MKGYLKCVARRNSRKASLPLVNSAQLQSQWLRIAHLHVRRRSIIKFMTMLISPLWVSLSLFIYAIIIGLMRISNALLEYDLSFRTQHRLSDYLYRSSFVSFFA